MSTQFVIAMSGVFLNLVFWDLYRRKNELGEQLEPVIERTGSLVNAAIDTGIQSTKSIAAETWNDTKETVELTRKAVARQAYALSLPERPVPNFANLDLFPGVNPNKATQVVSAYWQKLGKEAPIPPAVSAFVLNDVAFARRLGRSAMDSAIDGVYIDPGLSAVGRFPSNEQQSSSAAVRTITTTTPASGVKRWMVFQQNSRFKGPHVSVSCV